MAISSLINYSQQANEKTATSKRNDSEVDVFDMDFVI